MLAQENTKLKVPTPGTDPLPDTFKDGAQALADGKLGQDGVFRASTIQAKCASKYEAKPGQLAPGQAAPNINTGKSTASRGVIWKIWVRWPSCWPSVVALYATAASVVGRLKRKPFLIVSGGARGLFGVAAGRHWPRASWSIR